MEDEMADEFGGTVSKKTLEKVVANNDGGPAFACAAENGHQAGMSLRDWFAGQVLVGLVDMWGPERGSGIAYEYADAMLAARKGDGEDG